MGDTCQSRQGSWTAIVLLVCLCVAALLPFVDKAYTIDDPLFMWVANRIHEAPADFFRFQVNWETRPKPMWEETRNPPLAAYYIAAVGLAGGTGERVMHLAFIVPAALTIWGVYRLAQQFGTRPFFAALFVLVSPAFLVSSTTIMCDTMMLAFWVWALVWWDRGLRTPPSRQPLSPPGGRGAYEHLAAQGLGRTGSSRQWWPLALAGLLIGLGGLTKYFAICLVPLLAAYTIAFSRKLDYRILFLLIPVLMLAGYQGLTYHLYGQNLLYEAVEFSRDIQAKSAHRIGAVDKFIEGLSFTGGSVAPLLFLSVCLFRKRALAAAIAIMLLGGWLIYLKSMIGPFKIVLDDSSVRWWVITQVVVWSMVGAATLLLALLDYWQRRDAISVLLVLWVVGTFIFTAFLNWAINVRSVLPLVPAVGILIARRLQSRLNADSALKPRLAVCLVPALALSLALCWADFRFANSMREGASEIKDVAGERLAPSARLWFQGHWGFQYYMEKAGGLVMDRGRLECNPGDVVAIPMTNNYGNCLFPDDLTEHEATVIVPASRWLATMHMLMGAGYYANRIGPLPFAFGPVTIEEYQLFRVREPVRGELAVLRDGRTVIRPPAPDNTGGYNRSSPHE
jgi:4-amino-4-deoxy-L-arabinose transferase-like glycosyltransferase